MEDLSTSSSAWSVESEKWSSLFSFKWHLWEASAEKLHAETKHFSSKVCDNDKQTHAISTLACLVSLRLSNAWYFTTTEIEKTSTAVVGARPINTSCFGFYSNCLLFPDAPLPFY